MVMFRINVYLAVLVLVIGYLNGKSIPDGPMYRTAAEQQDDLKIQEDAEDAADRKLFEQLMAIDDDDDDHEADNDNDDDEDNPEENADLFEGDIMLPSAGAVYSKSKWGSRNAHWKNYFWRNGVLPYTFQSGYPRIGRDRVVKALAKLNKLLNAQGKCMTIRPKESWDQEFVVVVNPAEPKCSSFVGKDPDNRVQNINLHWSACRSTGTIQHEFIHALGFWHEQSRSDRNKYVKINWNNIIPGGAKRNFEAWNTRNQGFPYDYESVMHYPATAFAKAPGLITIETKNGEEIGQRIGASEQDIQEIRRFYKCD